MHPVRVNSESQENKVESDPFDSNLCIVIVEQLPIDSEDPAPIWRLSVAVELDTDRELLLNTILVGPFIHKRQAIAIAKFPSVVRRWVFWFESDHGRAEALVTLLTGSSVQDDCGLYALPHPPGACP